MNLLTKIAFHLPNNDHVFGDELLSFLAAFGKRDGDQIVLHKSDQNFVPNIAFELSQIIKPEVSFITSDHQITLAISNKTGQEQKSPETYQPISIDIFKARMAELELARLDHVGFNLPWLEGVHPDIATLRKTLPKQSAYYRFPTGEEWDFILPATEEEVRTNVIDLTKDRHPKLEVVSFKKSSTPLIQIDFTVRERFEKLTLLFPEGIADNHLKNVWVYLTNPYGIDICLVAGEYQDGDWSEFFSGNRLSA